MKKWTYNYLQKCLKKNIPPLVSFQQFKQYHKQLPMGRTATFERVVAEINSVIVGKRACIIYFDNSASIIIYYDGYYERFNSKGRLQSTGGTRTMNGINYSNFHLQVSVYGRLILLERLIAVSVDISNNTMPLYYDDILANVMDGTGSLKTAAKFDCAPNFEPNNIEWCSISANSSHGWLSKKLFTITKHVYRFSAEDVLLKNIVQSQKYHIIMNYCSNNLYKVK